MELRHLRYFKALAEQLNFTRAAERLHVTQSTLSHQIRQLEDMVGVPLLERKGKRISLTHAGRCLLDTANRTLDEIDGTLRDLKSIQEPPLAGRLAIGATHTFSIKLLGRYLNRFLQEFPRVRLELLELSAQDIENGLVNESLDIGIAYTPSTSGELWSEPLFMESLVLVTSKNHPFAGRKRLRMVELHNQKLVMHSSSMATRKLLDSYFEQAGARPAIVAEANSTFPMIHLVQTQKVAGILSEKAIPEDAGLHQIILHDPAPTRMAALLWKKDRQYPPTALEFAKLLKENY